MLSIKCLLELLKVALHFNFSQRVTSAVCKYLAIPSRMETKKLTELIGSTIKEVFATDDIGFKTASILESASHAAQKNSYIVHPMVIVWIIFTFVAIGGSVKNQRTKFASICKNPFKC